MWRQGRSVSPKWEGELELDSATDYDNLNEEVDCSVTYDLATENVFVKNYISVVRES